MKNSTCNFKKLTLILCFHLLLGVGYSQVSPVSGGFGETSSNPNNAANGGAASGLGCGGGGANALGGNGGNGKYGGGGAGAAGFTAINMRGGAGGQGVVVVAFYNGVTLLNCSVYISGTSFVVIPLTTNISIWVIGAGGGGAGSTNDNATVGGAGAAGGTSYKNTAVLPGNTITYSLGAAGAGGIDANNGATGGTTTAVVGIFTITANGGGGGQYNNNVNAAGGTFSGGDGGSTGGIGKGHTGNWGGSGGGGIGGTRGAVPIGGDGANGANAADVSGLFAVLLTGTVMPVTWHSFTAINQNKSVLLQWQTSFEQNNLHYTVQHSTNGINYSNLEVVEAAGNSNIITTYSYLHQNPPTGISYYRLLQTDIVGRQSFSIVLKNSVYAVTENNFTVITNPVITGNLQVQLNKNAAISLFGTDGKLVYFSNLQKGLNTINVAGLPKGHYMLQSETTTQKIIIQ